jgi:hypothetical protein
MAVLWDVAPCTVVETDRRFRGNDDGGQRWPISTGLQGAISQKTAIFVQTVVGYKRDIHIDAINIQLYNQSI